MSLSNKQPASLSEYSQLCKAKNPDSFSEAYHCMESQKDFSKTEFEWQRTEGKLHEIGLNVNSGGQIKDGLVKNAGFTDEDKLCFFEVKLDKDLKIAPKDQREIEVQGKKYQAAPGHLENWSLISEPFSSAEGNLTNPKTTEFPLGNEAITDQEKAAGKSVMETKCQQDLPDLPVSGTDPSKYTKEPEISVWNPNFNPVLSHNLGSKEATGKKDGAPGYCVVGVVNDNYVQSGFASLLATSKPGPPTTTVELAQDDSKSGYFSNINEIEEERFLVGLGEKLGSADDGSCLNRAAQQRKVMRRAMSECSHLSVPLALNLADKYPEPMVKEDVATGLLSPTSNLTQSSSPMTRKPGAPMKRSATVSEEQTSVHSLSTAQNNAELSSLIGKEHQSLRTEEPAAKRREEGNSSSSSSSAKKELVSPGLYHSKLEQIPEIGSHEKGKEEGEAAKRVKRNASNEAASLDSPRSRGGEMESAKTAPVEREEIEVSNVQNAPSSHRGDLPRDAKAEESTPAEVMTGNDISAPPNKELPPSPEKKAKPSASTPSAKPAATKAKPLSATSPKRPVSATPGQNKKATSPSAGPAAATTPKRPATSTTRPSTLTPRDTKPKVRSVALSRASSRKLEQPEEQLHLMSRAIKTEGKPADAKKTVTKSPSADLSRPKTAPASSTKSSATTPTAPGTAALPGAAASRPKPKPAAPRPTTAPVVSADTKKSSTLKTAPKTSTAPKPPRPTTSVSAPDLKNVRSKIGSTDNMKHQPGGGRVQIQNKKVDVSKVSSKCGSKVNIKHKPGGGDIKIENQKLNFKDKAQAKVGSLDSAGGTVKVGAGGSKEAAPPNGAVTASPAGGGGSGGTVQENGVGPAAPALAGGDQREMQCFETHMQETSKCPGLPLSSRWGERAALAAMGRPLPPQPPGQLAEKYL
uniref:Microtubule-associated protein n=1 Tax=Sphenodon punctatus TaxID=8508 RepID=A0A8D0HWH1_SPHPU